MSSSLTFAAIDIGSNAARMQISRVMLEKGVPVFKKVEYVRFPLQLGKDVFTINKIGKEREAKLLKLMKTFKLLMELHEVDDYMACATSAMRNAENGTFIQNLILQETDIHIRIISGEQEAEMINEVVFEHIDSGLYLHVDVGGGSTELNIYNEQKKLHAVSFKLGSLRDENSPGLEGVWKEMESWIKQHLGNEPRGLVCIGTGGNISKIYSILTERRKSKDKKRLLTYSKIHELVLELQSYEEEERMSHFGLNPDRSDVIIPASEIYLHVMRIAHCKKILVPDIGLKDGMIRYLYNKHQSQLKLF